MSKSLPPEKILFVLNPISGGRDKTALIPEIEDFCHQQKFDFYIYQTTGEDDKKKISEFIKEHNPDTLVAIGGDGTVNLCASVIVNTDVKLGIIPWGSGNGLSKDLLVPQNNLEAALSLLIKPHLLAMDTLEANGHFFLHLCDIGFNAHIVRLFSMSNRRGLATYAYYMVREFFNYKSSRYHIYVDGLRQLKIRAFMITAANSNKFGSNITINPNGKVNDGLFELIILKAFPYKVLPKLIWQIFWKRIHFSPYSKIFKSDKIVIEHRKGKTLQVDGEIVGRFKKIEITIKPASLNVIVPKEMSQ